MSSIYLASRSPRRLELLSQIGVSCTVIDVDIDETAAAGEAASDLVVRLAREKAAAGWRQSDRSRSVLAADTIVVIDDKVLGKPAGKDDACAMLQRLSGRQHEVMTAVTIVEGDREQTALSISRVSFRTLSQAEIEWYWASGEPADKAGGYAIQGRAAMFIAGLEGSYSGVMGLPLFETAALLGEFEVKPG